MSRPEGEMTIDEILARVRSETIAIRLSKTLIQVVVKVSVQYHLSMNLMMARSYRQIRPSIRSRNLLLLMTRISCAMHIVSSWAERLMVSAAATIYLRCSRVILA
jgi:hypothetical protein